MSEIAQNVAKVMEVGGGAVAVTPAAINYLGWIDAHSQAALVFIAAFGAMVSGIGMVLHVCIYFYFKHRENVRRQIVHDERVKGSQG